MRRLEPYWTWTVTRGVSSVMELEGAKPVENTEHPAAALYYMAHQLQGRTFCLMLDLAPHMDDARTLRALRETIAAFRRTGSCLILLDHDSKLPEVIQCESTRFDVSLPGQQELAKLVRDTLRRAHKKKAVDVRIKQRELDIAVRNLRGLTRSAARQIVLDTIADDQTFDAEDINRILAQKRRHLHHDGLLEFVESPVDLTSIGGMRNLKQWLKQREDVFSAEAAQFGLVPPRGLLLLGVQGAGKSLAAKAIATGWKRPLLRLDPSVLYDRYVGESERRLRQALDQAQAMAPIVLWIDEIEKGFASAAAHSTDGGLSQRMFGTLLTWMQEHGEPVFLVATANNIEALPPELLRKGRFDEIFFVDLPDAAVRRQILEIHLRKRNREPQEFDVHALASASDGFSGAEIEQAVIAALHCAFSEKAELGTRHIMDAISQTAPLSVTMRERVAGLREWAEGRCVPAD
jgi:SpoVK/Ycf46/Vps4 family AAA+-type ATPase